MVAVASPITVRLPLQAPQGRIERGYMLVLALVLLGYGLDGRGFAYIGYPPLFIGELTVAAGLVLLVRARSWKLLGHSTALVLLIPLLAWGVVRTLPFVRTIGFDAIRDLAVLGYSACAVVVAVMLLDRPAHLRALLGWYRRYILILLPAIPVVTVIYRMMWPQIPRWPWAEVPIVHQKEGDVLVQLAGILAFWTAGLAGRVRWGWLVLLTASCALMGGIDRAGLIGFTAVLCLCIVVGGANRAGWRVLAVLAVCVALMGITGFRMEVPGGKGREISFDQFVLNVRGVLGDAGTEGMDSTKEWRLDWWTDIAKYTLDGPYFWRGKGFGVNLADDDGYQVLRDGSLRNPHNVHMNVLARAGVPGLALWVAVQGAWIAAVVRGYGRASRNGHRRWQGLFFFVGCFWLACMINASFDVFLEGPMGALWFWTIFGIGVAAPLLYERDPSLLEDQALET